jgi:hypothetical protein
MKTGISKKPVETTQFLYPFNSCNQFASHAKFGGERKNIIFLGSANFELKKPKKTLLK